jgi:hypothetical protein
MTTALTPELALAYLAELAPAIQAVAVLAEDGELLAGDRNLVSQVGQRHVLSVRGPRHTLLARVGEAALVPLALHDLETVVQDLDG